MGLTVLQLIQSACYETNSPAPASLTATPTNTSELQLLNLFYSAGRKLRSFKYWDQLKRKHTIYLEAGRAQYPLPQDFYCAVPMTAWDLSQRWQITGPLTDRNFNFRQYGYATTQNHQAYRVWGPDQNPASTGGQFMVDPTPADAAAGIPITFEYISKNWIIPPNWVASTAYSLNDYRNVNGNIYKVTTAGSSGTNPPNMANAQGRDGSCWWTYVSTAAWQVSTAYAPGEYVTNGGNTYRCTIGGISASSGGPSGTDTAIEDGTVTWQYISITAWAAQTDYVYGQHVSNSSKLYRNTSLAIVGTNGQKSGKLGPDWTATTIPDGSAVWTYQPQAFETLITSSDLCAFDDEVMISALKWRFLRARGLEYADIEAEAQALIDAAVGRWNTGRKISLCDGDVGLAGLNPNVPEGNFGNGEW